MVFLIAGLGNPGKSYEASRHNIGFRVVERLADRHGWSWGSKGSRRFSAATASGFLEETRVELMKPMTYMNLSGEAVGAAWRYYKVPAEHVAVVHDDLDLALGRIQVRQGGGDGGHRGVRSILEVLGESGFTRFRVGIGRPEAEREATDYVLEAFSPEELQAVGAVVDRAVEGLEVWMRDGLTAAMNRVNPWPGQPSEE